MSYPSTSQRGFTLIEVMVVVVILGILAAVLVPKVMDRPDEARITKARQDIRALEASLNLYKLDNFNYPTTEQGLEALHAVRRNGRAGAGRVQRHRGRGRQPAVVP